MVTEQSPNDTEFYSTGHNDSYSYSVSYSGYHTNAIISLDSIPLIILLSKLIAFGSIMFLTIVGNGIVIIIILVNKHMRTTTYFYLLNLAVADVTIAVFNEWLWLSQNLINNWLFGFFMCKISSFVIGVSVQVSILTLTVVAGDRCFAIVYPLQSRVVKSSGALVSLAIFLVWTIAIVLNIPIIFFTVYEQHTWDDNVTQQWCTEDRAGDQMFLTIYTVLLFILTYVVPLLIMLIAYVLIAKTLNSRGAGLECTTTAQDKSKRKVVKMLVVVVSTFAICWLPNHVYQLLRTFHFSSEIRMVEFAVLWLGYANSAMNPFIYCGFNENFRRGFRDTFQGKLFRRRKNIDFKSFKSSQSCAPSDGTVMETTVI